MEKVKIFRDFSVEELDHQYSPSRWVKRVPPEESVGLHCTVVAQG